jgi:hypothetical protein
VKIGTTPRIAEHSADVRACDAALVGEDLPRGLA